MPGICLFLALLAFAAPEIDGDDDIKEAVFRHQMQQYKASTYYLAFGNTEKGNFVPPSKQFMYRFGSQPEVKAFSGSYLQSSKAVILSVDSIARKKNNSAEVAARFVFSDPTKASAGFYQLVQETPGIWKVVGKKSLKIIPLDQR